MLYNIFMSSQEISQSTWSVEPIALTDVPPEAVAHFMDKSIELVHRGMHRHHPDGFRQFLLANEGDGVNTYAAHDVKTKAVDFAKEQFIYVTDHDASGEEVGYGDIRLVDAHRGTYHYDKPFVGYTRTHPTKQRQGYGLRRLHAMNALSEHVFGLKLHSDTLLSGEAHNLWKRLVDQHVAVTYLEGPHTRYRFQ
jgi:hypothetical protein